MVVLGRAGRNFGAGMSNGVAYVLDEAGTFATRLNPDMVELTDLDEADKELLRRLVREHEEKTASPRARRILVEWDQFRPLFRKVAPKGAAAFVAVHARRICGRAGGARARPRAPQRLSRPSGSDRGRPSMMPAHDLRPAPGTEPPWRA